MYSLPASTAIDSEAPSTRLVSAQLGSPSSVIMENQMQTVAEGEINLGKCAH